MGSRPVRYVKASAQSSYQNCKCTVPAGTERAMTSPRNFTRVFVGLFLYSVTMMMMMFTLLIAHFLETYCSPWSQHRLHKSVSMEENKTIRAPQYLYARERYHRAAVYPPASLATKEHQEQFNGLHVHPKSTRLNKGHKEKNMTGKKRCQDCVASYY